MPIQQIAIATFSYLLLLSGIAELVVSGIAIANSSAFGAAWYTGLACIFAGSQGIRVGPKQDLSRRFVKWIFASAMFGAVFSIFGTALDGTNYVLFNNFVTCASSTDDPNLSCNDTEPQSFECYGNPAFNADAVTCQQEETSSTCSCVSSSDQCTNNLNGFPNCNFILTDFVRLLHGSFILCLVCLISSSILVVLCGYIWCFVSDLRESSLMLNDSLVLSESAAVTPAEAHISSPMRPSQEPINLSFVDIRPAGVSTIERYEAGDTSRLTTTAGAIFLRPSAVKEVTALTAAADDAIATPVNVAYPLQPAHSNNRL